MLQRTIMNTLKTNEKPRNYKKINKDMKNQMEIWGVKNLLTNSLDGLNSRMEITEEGISELVEQQKLSNSNNTVNIDFKK